MATRSSLATQQIVARSSLADIYTLAEPTRVRNPL
jgi:hypothetical protein